MAFLALEMISLRTFSQTKQICKFNGKFKNYIFHFKNTNVKVILKSSENDHIFVRIVAVNLNTKIVTNWSINWEENRNSEPGFDLAALRWSASCGWYRLINSRVLKKIPDWSVTSFKGRLILVQKRIAWTMDLKIDFFFSLSVFRFSSISFSFLSFSSISCHSAKHLLCSVRKVSITLLNNVFKVSFIRLFTFNL